MSSDTPQAADTQSVPQAITFHHIKSNFFRVIHADGVWGGVTPHLQIQMAFFSERLPIPEIVKHTITPDGQLGKEVVADRVTREGVVREIEASVVVSLEVAKVLRAWLDEKIQLAESVAVNNNQKESSDEPIHTDSRVNASIQEIQS